MRNWTPSPSIISANIFERDLGGGTLGPKLAYVYDDGGTIKYNEKSLDDSAVTFANADLADRHLGRIFDAS